VGTRVWSSNAFGSTKANSDPDKDSIHTNINIRFLGQYFDKESNLHYNNQRYYDSSTGRHIASDSIGLEGTSLPSSCLGALVWMMLCLLK